MKATIMWDLGACDSRQFPGSGWIGEIQPQNKQDSIKDVKPCIISQNRALSALRQSRRNRVAESDAARSFRMMADWHIYRSAAPSRIAVLPIRRSQWPGVR